MTAEDMAHFARQARAERPDSTKLEVPLRDVGVTCQGELTEVASLPPLAQESSDGLGDAAHAILPDCPCRKSNPNILMV